MSHLTPSNILHKNWWNSSEHFVFGLFSFDGSFNLLNCDVSVRNSEWTLWAEHTIFVFRSPNWRGLWEVNWVYLNHLRIVLSMLNTVSSFGVNNTINSRHLCFNVAFFRCRSLVASNQRTQNSLIFYNQYVDFFLYRQWMFLTLISVIVKIVIA